MGFLSLLLSFVLYIQDSVAMVFYWKICRTHRLSLEEFVPWLERRLLDASIYELIGLNRCLYLIEVRIAKVKEYSHEYRSSASTITTPLATRIQKVCDHIENINGVALNRLELEKVMSSNGAQPLTFLPDRTQLYDFIHRLKDKLKAIDELASSKKTDNSKAKNAKFASSNRSESKKAQELNAIKAELKKLATLLEELRVIIEDKRVILDYYGSMKLNVHVPLNDIFYRISTLPSIDDAKAIAQISFHDLKRCEDQYNSARVSDGLVTIAQLNSEIEFIEMEISSLTKPLADTLSISKTSRTKEEPIRSEGVAETPPEQHLDAEVRDAIANGDVTDAFSKILQLTSSMGQFSRGDRLFLMEKLEVTIQTVGTYVKATSSVLENRKEKNNQERIAAWFSSLQKKQQSVIRSFDFELFDAYMRDWRDRVKNFDQIVETESFVEEYKKLMNCRSNLLQRRYDYEDSVRYYDEIVIRHQEVLPLIKSVKEALADIALSELQEMIEFTD